MIVGATGSGKSTMMNAILSGSHNMDYNEDYNIIAKK